MEISTDRDQAADPIEAATSLPTGTLREISEALASGEVTSVELVATYLNRVAYFDRAGIALNAAPVLDPEALERARDADRLRESGEWLGPLHGIPFMVKDSYAVAGMSLAAGSPAFQDLRAREDAGAVALLRRAGAIVLGKTTMPPMAAGGMQRGVYGRPVSPYNPDCLPAGWLSGSSSGSAVAVAAGLCTFGLGEETLSSGRSPASCNALAAYVPSRGLISLRGNWPLMSLRDQPAPYARTVDDLLTLLDVLVCDDEEDPSTAIDLWRDQEVVELPRPSTVRPRAYHDLRDAGALEGVIVGVPRIFVGKDTSGPEDYSLHPPVQRLWNRAEEDLRALGATVVEVDPPAFRSFTDLTEARTLAELGYWPADFPPREWVQLIASTWDAYLRHNADPKLAELRAVADFSAIYPEELHGLGPEVNPMGRYDYEGIAAEAARGPATVLEVEGIAEALRGLERFREDHLERWMDAEGIGLLAFPCHTGVGPADADREPEAALRAWKPGVNYALGGTAMRALGIPSVVAPMGLTEDTGMPIGITFAGRAYGDSSLLAAAYAYERHTGHRVDPLHAPVAARERIRPARRTARREDPESAQSRVEPAGGGAQGELRVTVLSYDGRELRFSLEVAAEEAVRELEVTLDGIPVRGARVTGALQELAVTRPGHGPRSTADGGQGGLLVAVAVLERGDRLGAFAELDRPRRYDG